jgi:hypothetical protein
MVGQLWDLDNIRGTSLGLQEFIYAASNYRTIVVNGVNSLLTPDDSEFATGVGHWLKYTNPHYVDMTDTVPEPDTHPPSSLNLTSVVLRPYASTDLPTHPGRGVLEVIDLPTPTLHDFVVVCGLSANGGFDGTQETDWYHFGIPVQANDIWQFQFQCCHKTGAPNATVIGSFVMYDRNGVYIGTTPGPISDLTDSTAWQTYSFQYQFTAMRYVFPAIWWHAATALQARYVCSAQMSAYTGIGGLAVVQPDIFLTLGATGKTLGSTKAILGPPPA